MVPGSGSAIGSLMPRISRFDSIKTESGFAGVAKVSTRDLQDKEIGTSEVRLEGKRIQVEPF
jgi:hypothetical protein